MSEINVTFGLNVGGKKKKRQELIICCWLDLCFTNLRL